MIENKHTMAGHLSAFGTIFLWGITFISTKVLLNTFTPVEILLIRFLIGYLCLWAIFPHRMKVRPWKEEVMFVAAGLSGVTLYFLFENTAIDYSLASNVGVIVSIAPLFTGILASIFLHEEKISVQFLFGFLLSIMGIIVIGYNGSTVLKLNPLGDVLAVLAAAVWSVYSIIMRKISDLKLNTIGVTRKIFFYGLLFMIPVISLWGFDVEVSQFLNFNTILNLLFLSVGASAICYVTWNWSVGILGAVKTSVYIYLIPVISVVASIIFLHEPVTWIALGGSLLTLMGLYLSERRVKVKTREAYAES